MNKKSLLVSFALIIGVVVAHGVFGHVTVKPNQVGVASYQNFTVGVPNEKDIPTVAIRLLIPEGLSSVMPLVKQGWQVELKQVETPEGAKVTEIIWTGNSVPKGFKDEFVFSAKSPTVATSVLWKAYQTYQDGTIVAWDLDPKDPKLEDHHAVDGENIGPYSITKVVDDLTGGAAKVDSGSGGPIPLILSIVALVLVLLVFVRSLGRKK